MKHLKAMGLRLPARADVDCESCIDQKVHDHGKGLREAQNKCKMLGACAPSWGWPGA